MFAALLLVPVPALPVTILSLPAAISTPAVVTLEVVAALPAVVAVSFIIAGEEKGKVRQRNTPLVDLNVRSHVYGTVEPHSSPTKSLIQSTG